MPRTEEDCRLLRIRAHLQTLEASAEALLRERPADVVPSVSAEWLRAVAMHASNANRSVGMKILHFLRREHEVGDAKPQ